MIRDLIKKRYEDEEMREIDEKVMEDWKDVSKEAKLEGWTKIVSRRCLHCDRVIDILCNEQAKIVSVRCPDCFEEHLRDNLVCPECHLPLKPKEMPSEEVLSYCENCDSVYDPDKLIKKKFERMKNEEILNVATNVLEFEVGNRLFANEVKEKTKDEIVVRVGTRIPHIRDTEEKRYIDIEEHKDIGEAVFERKEDSHRLDLIEHELRLEEVEEKERYEMATTCPECGDNITYWHREGAVKPITCNCGAELRIEMGKEGIREIEVENEN